MNQSKLLSFIICLALSAPLFAQDATLDEIIDGYLENTGGKENWENLQGVKMNMTINQQGLEIPIEAVQLADGRQYNKFTVQGNSFYQEVFDGTTLWGTNFMSMTNEKATAEELENFKLDLNDFPEALINYKEKGYTAELLGLESLDGTETYKIKLVKEPRMVDGKEVEDITFYYFDVDAFIPIAQESMINQGPQTGQMGIGYMSDYDEVDGYYFPFSMTQGVKGGPQQPVIIKSIEVNPKVEEGVFAFPEK